VIHPLTVLLADGPKTTGPDVGKASPVGLLVVVLLLLAVFVLVWSMNRHLKKARDHFAAAESSAPVEAPRPSAEGGGSAATREPSGEPGG
jgi:hypothetical protein